jgi:hypothetical protein
MLRSVLVALVLVLAAVPAAEARKRCSQLHGRDLAPAKHVRIVDKRTSSGRSLYGCILPRGPWRELADAEEYETSNDSYELLAVAREWVLIFSSSATQYGGGNGTYVWNVRTDDGYSIARSCFGMICTPGDPTDSAVDAVLTNTGEAAAIVDRAGGRRLELFTAWGAVGVADTGPDLAGLRLDGRTAHWTNAGAARSAEL